MSSHCTGSFIVPHLCAPCCAQYWWLIIKAAVVALKAAGNALWLLTDHSTRGGDSIVMKYCGSWPLEVTRGAVSQYIACIGILLFVSPSRHQCFILDSKIQACVKHSAGNVHNGIVGITFLLIYAIRKTLHALQYSGCETPTCCPLQFRRSLLLTSRNIHGCVLKVEMLLYDS